MGYHLVYGFDDAEPKDGPHLASGGGWLAWCEWSLGFDGYDEVHCLAENGWSADLDTLSDELKDLATEEGDEDLKAITKTLTDAVAAAVAARPDGAKAVAVSDGTPPGEDDEPDDD